MNGITASLISNSNRFRNKLKNEAGLNTNFKPIIPEEYLPYLPFKQGPNSKHANRFRIYKLIRNNQIKLENLEGVNLSGVITTQGLKKAIANAKEKKLKGLRNGENLGSSVVYSASNQKFYYKNNRGSRYEVKKDLLAGLNKWSATIGAGGLVGALTGKKIVFRRTVSSDGKPHFERVKNNNSKNKMNGGQAPAAAGATENYSGMNVYRLLEKYRNARNNTRRNAIEREINSKIESEITKLKTESRAFRMTQFSKILRALSSRRNFPGRSLIIGSIRSDIERAAKESRPEDELERIRRYIDPKLMPGLNSNVRRNLAEELNKVKRRERRYSEAYGSRNRNRNYNFGMGGFFPPPRPRNYGPPRNFGPSRNFGPAPPRNMGGFGPAPPRNFGGNMGPPPAPAQPKFNITGVPPPPINLPRVNVGVPGAPAGPAAPGGPLPVNLPQNEAAAIKRAGGVNAVANKINQAGGATNVAKTANALQKAGGNQALAIREGSNPETVRLVVELSGKNQPFNKNKVVDVLNGMNKVAAKIRRKRRTTRRAPRKAVHRKAPAPAKKRRAVRKAPAPAKKRRVVRKAPAPAKKRRTTSGAACPMPRVRTGELNKLLNTVTKETIKRRIINSSLLNNATKNELKKEYKNHLLGRNK
jgi:hypothetical protein